MSFLTTVLASAVGVMLAIACLGFVVGIAVRLRLARYSHVVSES